MTATVRHRTECLCIKCRGNRIAQAGALRAAGQSFPTIAEELNVALSTAFRLVALSGTPTPAIVHGRNGRKYGPRDAH